MVAETYKKEERKKGSSHKEKAGISYSLVHIHRRDWAILLAAAVCGGGGGAGVRWFAIKKRKKGNTFTIARHQKWKWNFLKEKTKDNESQTRCHEPCLYNRLFNIHAGIFTFHTFFGGGRAIEICRRHPRVALFFFKRHSPFWHSHFKCIDRLVSIEQKFFTDVHQLHQVCCWRMVVKLTILRPDRKTRSSDFSLLNITLKTFFHWKDFYLTIKKEREKKLSQTVICLEILSIPR